MTSKNLADDKDDKKKTSDEDFALGVKMGKEEGKEDAKQDADKKTGDVKSK